MPMPTLGSNMIKKRLFRLFPYSSSTSGPLPPFPHTQESCKWDPSAANGNGIVCSRQLLPPRAKVWKAWLVRSRLVHFLLGKFDVHSSLLEKTSQWETLEASKSVYIILYNIFFLKSAPLLDIVSAATLDSWPFPSTPHFWFWLHPWHLWLPKARCWVFATTPLKHDSSPGSSKIQHHGIVITHFEWMGPPHLRKWVMLRGICFSLSCAVQSKLPEASHRQEVDPDLAVPGICYHSL